MFAITWNVETICTLILLGFMAVYIYLERVIPYTKGLPFFRKGMWIDMIWYTFIQSFFLKILIFDWMIAPLEIKLGIAENGYLSHWPIWALVLLFLVTHDFYIYWFHRLQHANKWLWRTHEAHHSVENVDWLAGSRSHVFEIIINQTIEFLPIIFLLDVETAAIVVPIKALLDAVWGQFIHANIDVKLGKLGYVINGPEYHQWHHADHVEVYHANFATKFSIWDWIFKTAYHPDRKPTRFGVWYEFPRDWFMQHVFSIYRFNVKALEQREPFKTIFNLRIAFINACIPTLRHIFPAAFKQQNLLNGDPIYGHRPELSELKK